MVFYYIYLFLIALPLLLACTIVAAILTIIGSMIGFSRSMGYYPGHVWARIFCFLCLVRIKVHGKENISKNN